VRLRIKVRDSATATVAGGNDGGTPVAELSVKARSSVKISFHVDGNLNAAELAAIQDVVAQVGALADQFFAGDLPAAFASAQDLNMDGSQLAKVGLRLSQRSSAWEGGDWPRLLPPATSVQPEPAAAPAAAESPPAVAEAVTGVAQTAVTDPAPTPSVTGTPAAQTGTEPADVPDAPTSVAGSVLVTIAGFLQQLLDTLGSTAEPSDGATQASLSMSLKLRLFAVTVVNLTAAAAVATDGGEQSAAPIVADTLDALVAVHQPRLSVSA
jgi:hypothetical protein